MTRRKNRMTAATGLYLVLVAAFAILTLVNLGVALKQVESLIIKSQESVQKTRLEGFGRHLATLETSVEGHSSASLDGVIAAWAEDSTPSRIMVVMDETGRILTGGNARAVEAQSVVGRTGDRDFVSSDGKRYWFVYETFPEYGITAGYEISWDHRFERIRRLRSSFLPTFIIIPLFTLLLFALLIMRIVIPLRRLTASAEAIAKGNLDLPIGIRQSDEIGLLARSFDNMRKAVKDRLLDLAEENKRRRIAERELSELNESLEKKVSERTRELSESIADLKAAQRQLVEAEKSASLATLIVGMAHEINTPLGIGVTGLSHMNEELEKTLDRAAMTEEDFRRTIRYSIETSNMAISSLMKVGNLIKSLRSFSTRDADDSLQDIRLLEYLSGFVEVFRPRLDAAGCRIAIEGDEDLSLTTYPNVLLQVVSRLFDNALNHGLEAREDSIIHISLESLGDSMVRLRFHDNGHGMEPEIRKRIFEPFYTTDRKVGRPGLGLYIVYNLVDKYLRGTIECCSETTRGTCFILDLPDLPAEAESGAASQDSDQWAI